MKLLLISCLLLTSACASNPSREVASTRIQDEVVGVSICNSSADAQVSSWDCQDLK